MDPFQNYPIGAAEETESPNQPTRDESREKTHAEAQARYRDRRPDLRARIKVPARVHQLLRGYSVLCVGCSDRRKVAAATGVELLFARPDLPPILGAALSLSGRKVAIAEPRHQGLDRVAHDIVEIAKRTNNPLRRETLRELTEYFRSRTMRHNGREISGRYQEIRVSTRVAEALAALRQRLHANGAYGYVSNGRKPSTGAVMEWVCSRPGVVAIMAKARFEDVSETRAREVR